MSGSFSPGTQPPLPGAYFDFQVAAPQPVLVNTLGIVAIPFVHPWGPANQVVTLNSFGDFIQFYGTGGLVPPSYSPGYIAVKEAFQGEGLPGRGGAAQVVAYRMVGSSGAVATLTIQNTTPADAITVTAVYKGSFGNKLAYTNTANASNPSTQSDFTVYVNGAAAEVFTYNKTDIVGLAALINDPLIGSKWIDAVELITGVALAVQSTPVSLASGNDGSTLVSGDYTAAFSAFAWQEFSLFAPHDLEDSSILASLVSWQATLNSSGRRCITVVGGPSNDTATAAATRSAGINDPNVINIGVGTYADANLSGITLNTAQLAPRLAGIIAARGDAGGLSFSRMQGLSVLTTASDFDVLNSITHGWMAISRDSNAIAPVRFEKGVTTFISTTDVNRPFYVYSNPKFIRTMQSIERTITEWAEFNVIGVHPVDTNTVEYVIGFVKQFFKQMEADEVVQPGWTVTRSMNPPPQPTDDFITLQYSVSFMRDTEKILNIVTVQ